MSKQQIKTELLRKLHDNHIFWSYDKNSCHTISDWNLIKFVMIHLDLDDIDLLFEIYPKSKIKKVWINELIIQGYYLKNMNICFANHSMKSKNLIGKLGNYEKFLFDSDLKHLDPVSDITPQEIAEFMNTVVKTACQTR
jgi:hypothetical protein